MSTSGSTNFSTDRNTIIESAYRIAGITAEGEVPTTDQYTYGATALNMMVKAFQIDGMPLWAIKSYSIDLTLSSASYRIGNGETVDTPKPLKIIQAFNHNTSTNIDIPMRILTRDEYNRLGNKTITGNPIQIYYDPQNSYGDLYVFPTADANAVSYNQIKIFYQRPFEDFDASTDEPDFPQEWYEAVTWGLAYRLAAEYQMPILHRQSLKKDADEFRALALSFGTEEGSLFVRPDYRYGSQD